MKLPLLLPLLLAPLALHGADPAVLGKTATGAPPLSKIDVLGFAPGGVLLIGDGSAQQILAVQVEEPGAPTVKVPDIPGLSARIAERMGTPKDGIEIIDLAVAPGSGRPYLAVRKQDDKSQHLIRINAGGELELVPLQDVTFARIAIPAGDNAPVSLVTDVVWAGDRVVAAARCNEEFASKIFAAEAPLDHDRPGQLYAAETFHISHNKWETRAPMNVMIPFEEDGKRYIIGAYSCTPVVKYPIDAIQPGARIKGLSMIELGSGNRPLDMFAYGRDGKTSVLTNTFRFHHEKRPYGPSPHLAFRFDEKLLGGGEAVNEKAVRRLDGKDPASARIEIAEAFHGVTQMDRLDETTALALREADGDVDLVSLALP